VPVIPIGASGGGGGFVPSPVNCDVSGIQYALASWDAVVSSDFDHYEIQRRLDSVFSPWATIALLSDISQTQFADFECPLGAESLYRMRWVRGDGAPSDWTAVETATPEASACNWQLTSNHVDPGLYVQGHVMDDPLTWQFDVNRTTHPLFDDDDRVSFLGTEQRGPVIEIDEFLIAGGSDNPAQIRGLGNFAVLLFFGFQPAPYTCVRDPDGNTYYAAVSVPEGRQSFAGTVYDGRLLIETLTTVPVPATV
jgi:hypothetical protein